MKKFIERALKAYASLALKTLDKVDKLTDQEKKELLDTLNKVSETNQLTAQILKGNIKDENRKVLLKEQFELWSKGEETKVEFKNTLR